MSIQQIYKELENIINKEDLNASDYLRMENLLAVIQEEIKSADKEIEYRQEYFEQVRDEKLMAAHNYIMNTVINNLPEKRPAIWMRIIITFCSIFLMSSNLLAGLLYTLVFFRYTFYKYIIDKFKRPTFVFKPLPDLLTDGSLRIAENNFKIMLKKKEILTMLKDVIMGIKEQSPEVFKEILSRVDELIVMPVDDYELENDVDYGYQLVPKLKDQ